MNRAGRLLIGLMIVATWAGGAAAQEQDTVVITKTRLEELERKEAELERLQRELRKAPDEVKNAYRATNQIEKPAAGDKPTDVQAESAPPAALTPVAIKPTPSLSTLGPLPPEQVVEAADLLNHYRSEPKVAAKRYEKNRIRVAGEIVGFDKPLLERHATITLKTAEQSGRVVCRLDPPANLPNLFTVENGDALVGSASSSARSVLARVGQRAVIEGWCQGLKGQAVTLTSAKLISVH